ncbi:MAG: hypothetical protein IID17_11935 [Nitrospinae bacterium]|nr:hypothetical protein [Nitrospinota bacterium]
MKKFISIIITGIFLFCMLSSAEALVREVAKKWDNVAVAVDTDWFAQDLTSSTNAQRSGVSSNFDAPVKHTFQFSCPTATVINLQLKYNAVTKVVNFNGGEAIGSNDGHQFSVILHSGMSYNIQHKTSTQACAVVITESFNVDL